MNTSSAPSARSALKAVAADVARSIDEITKKDAEKGRKQAEEEAERNKPENVRKRNRAEIAEIKKRLGEAVEHANPELEKRISVVRDSRSLNPQEKQRVIEDLKKLTITGSGKIVAYDDYYGEYSELSVPPALFIFNKGTFCDPKSQVFGDFYWGKGTYATNNNVSVNNILTAAEKEFSARGDKESLAQFKHGMALLRGLADACQKQNVGMLISGVPYQRHVSEYRGDPDYPAYRHDHERMAGIYVQILPLQDFNPDQLPAIVFRQGASRPEPLTPAGCA